MGAIYISLGAKKAIKALEQSGRIGRIEYSSGHYRYNGDSTDKLVLNGVDIGVSENPNNNYVRISEDYIRGDLIDQITLYVGPTDFRVFEKDKFSVTDIDGVYFVHSIQLIDGYQECLVLVFPDDSGIGGVYVLEKAATAETYFRISDIVGNFVENITPIDPKFVPPMDSITLNGADGKQYSVTVDSTGALAVTAIE